VTYWFTADCHIGHEKIIEYEKRPFCSVEEMDYTIFENWRAYLRPGDTFCVVGDIAIKKKHALRALNKIPRGVHTCFIFGNHEDDHRGAILRSPRVMWAGDLKTIKVEGQHLFLFHYACRVWKRHTKNSWQLCGHSHGNLEPWENQLDVGVDNVAKLVGEYRPLSFYEVKKIIELASHPKTLAKRYGKAPSWVGSNNF